MASGADARYFTKALARSGRLVAELIGAISVCLAVTAET